MPLEQKVRRALLLVLHRAVISMLYALDRAHWNWR